MTSPSPVTRLMRCRSCPLPIVLDLLDSIGKQDCPAWWSRLPSILLHMFALAALPARALIPPLWNKHWQVTATSSVISFTIVVFSVFGLFASHVPERLYGDREWLLTVEQCMASFKQIKTNKQANKPKQTNKQTKRVHPSFICLVFLFSMLIKFFNKNSRQERACSER